jgi:peptidyl-prolyl cis-trans isomerase C
MMKRLMDCLSLGVACCLAAGFLPGCGREENPENILARVGDSAISLDDFRREWANQPPLPPGVPPDSVEKFLEDMIAEKLFLAEARRRKLDGDEELRREVERYREQLMVEKLLSQEVLTVPPPAPGEVEKFWAANREGFSVPELTRLSHIFVRPGEDESEESVIERCLSIRARLEGGEDFAAVAREVSEGSSKVRGGDLGYFREEQIVPEFRPAVSELAAGEVSGPIKTESGYHLLMVTDIRPPRQKTFEESREEVTAILLAEKRKARFDNVKAAIADSISVEKNWDLIERLQAEQSKALFPPGASAPQTR